MTQLQTGEGGSLLASHSQEQQAWGCRIRLLLAKDQLLWGQLALERAREPLSMEGCWGGLSPPEKHKNFLLFLAQPRIGWNLG